MRTEGEKNQSTSLRDLFPALFAAATVLYCAFIFYLSSIPSFPLPAPFPYFDKVAHFCLFGGLGGLVAIGLRQARHEYSAKMLFMVPFVFCLLYGISDEVHQLFVEGRTFDPLDILADGTGAAFAAGLLLFLLAEGILRRRNKGGAK